MTTLWLFSDLHQEHDDQPWDPAPHAPASFDAVVVAGDVHTPGERAVTWLADRFAGVPVVYVLGNHDAYWDRGEDRYTYFEAYERAQEAGARRGVHVLVDSEVTLAGARFLGGTLWTDMRYRTESRAQAYAEARRGMNDYHRVRRKASGKHRHLRVEETVAMHQATRNYLATALAEPSDVPTVVVTHHAPSPRSLPAGGIDLGFAYASNLEPLLEERGPALWVHGHLHSHVDYQVGRTRVVANPRGHVEELARSGFVPGMTAEVR